MGLTFISYSRRDTEIVDRIADSVQSAGLEIWLDRHDIRPGNQWRVQIVQAIDTCDVFVLMLSPNSAASDNVRKEIDLAQDSGRTIFAVMLEPVKLPPEIRYQLAGLQFIDVQQMGFDQSVSLLIDTIKKHIATLQPEKEPEQQQAELVIQGVDLKAFGADKKEQLLAFIAQLTNASPSQLSIAGMAAGSVHVFVDMPAALAYQLKTLALNRDRRFKRLGIASLRLAGDNKYVNIALGVLTAAATIGILQAIWLGIPSLFLPLVGATAGKVLTISLVVALTTGLAVSAPKALAPLMIPSPTFTSIPTSAQQPQPGSPIPTVLLSPLSESTQRSEQTPTLSTAVTLTTIASQTASPTFTPFLTATPQNPLVLVPTACFKEPRVNDRIVSSLNKGTRVKLIARSDDGNWWLVENPVYRSPCWVQVGDLQLDPGMNVKDVPVFYIFSVPTMASCTTTTSYSTDPVCYCKMHPGDVEFCYSLSQ